MNLDTHDYEPLVLGGQHWPKEKNAKENVIDRSTQMYETDGFVAQQNLD